MMNIFEFVKYVHDTVYLKANLQLGLKVFLRTECIELHCIFSKEKLFTVPILSGIYGGWNKTLTDQMIYN